MSKTRTTYNLSKKLPLDKNHCFLCGIKLEKKEFTHEHIFPQWLLDKYALWDKTLTLFNGTTIPYRQIKIPCCAECNNVHLSKLENTFMKRIEKGYESFKYTPKREIFLWLQKIYYELLYKDMGMLINRSDKKQGTILDKKILKGYKMAHLFLQATRLKVSFKQSNPWSIFIFKIRKHKNILANFDYKDSFYAGTIAIRMGDIGIIACLQDSGISEDLWKTGVNKIKKYKLHPLQFDELFATITYKASLLNRTPKYLVIKDKVSFNIFSMPLQGLSTLPIFNEWVPFEYAKVLSFYLKIPLEKCFNPPNFVITTLRNKKGEFLKLNFKNTLLMFSGRG